jgi:glutamate---cysteine ligase / carboxylate-amine ligase
MDMPVAMPAWARWNPSAAAAPWTVGIEEEVVLLSPDTWLPESRCEDVLAALPTDTASHACAETHGSALELTTSPHETVADAVAELAGLRAQLTTTLESLGLRAAVTGTHPTARWEHIEVSPGARYRYLHASMRELARREPTFGLHVHVGVPDPEAAVRAYNAMRTHVPMLLALSGNSPYWQGRDSGLASARTPAFQAFPRTGIPRRFGSWREYAEAVDVLLRSGAIPEPTFLWWDVRLQPSLGTLEMRVLDAQTSVGDTAALAALVQCLVRLEALADPHAGGAAEAPEVLAENRFIASRDGMQAELIEPPAWTRRAVGDRLQTYLHACAPHARALGCVEELARVPLLAEAPGAARQRSLAAQTGGLEGLIKALSDAFAQPVPVS